KLPKPGETLADNQFDLQENRFTLYAKGHKSEIVNDPKASDGKAARMPGNITDWAVQYHIKKEDKFSGPGPWYCYLVIRVDAKSKEGTAFQMGLFDAGNYVVVDRPG